MKGRLFTLLCTALFAQIATAQPDAAASKPATLATDQWRYDVTPYLWAIGVSGSISHGGDTIAKVSLNPGDVLSDLKMAGMVVAKAQRGRLGLYLDALYGDLGNTASKTVGPLSLSANTSLKLSMVTLAPSYRLYDSSAVFLDGLVGARYLWLDAKTTVSATGFTQQLSAQSTTNITVPVAGVKGRFSLGDSDYFVPFYVDVGAGEKSTFTTQAYLGIGRSFDWGDLSLNAKNVYYQFNQKIKI